MAEHSLEDEAAALDVLGRELFGLLPTGAEEIRLDAILLTTVVEKRVRAQWADGRTESVRLRGALTDALETLRAAMYREGTGTWFGVSLIVTAEGSVRSDFDYDGLPKWHLADAAPASYRSDLERYPRDHEHVPDWLRDRLETA